MISVRTAYAPEIGTIDPSTLKKLVRESDQLNAIPHFAGLTVTPVEKNEIAVTDNTEMQEFKVIFNGISAVHKSEVLAANN